ncbi:MAG: [Fe-Fe] hydrogenase large subunit C-terminal domain-containing protein [Melioribacteraceae bacterium]|nr:[Fe-Fe] hydrogenase large subunit C-terminal domain-containing protein [Melioribacteraceae bacterium]
MSHGIVTTIAQRCKRCYSCIRECPAKAIMVINGQAVVIEERCISCGHCVKVCSQNAKQILSDIETVIHDLIPTGNTIAMLAPSFPASFPENYSKVSSALRQIGFKIVTETAFGADLISKHYSEYAQGNEDRTIISSACPAVFNWIEKYFVDIVPNIAKVVSPMIAMGRYLKKNFGEDTKVVFIGPCVAKKSEYKDSSVSDAVDAVLTFKELKQIFEYYKIDMDQLPESDLDPPHAFLGKSFPLTGGLLKTANISGDILEKEIIVVEGKERVEEIIHEIADKKIKSKFIDILFCEGCINGPAIDSDLNFYSRREKVINFINENINSFDKHEWKGTLYNSRDLNLSRNFHDKNQRRPMPSEEEIKEILSRTNKFTKSDELNCGSCGYPNCREYAVAIAKNLAEDDMCLPFLIEKLESAYKELKETQEQLHSAEKLASIGQLAAGVAHEINNPLGSIMLYASMLKRKIEKCNEDPQSKEDLMLIIDEAKRCKNIVANLLNFARQGKLRIAQVNILELISGITKMLKVNPAFREINFQFDNRVDSFEIYGDSDQLKQVFLNIITNACEAMESSETKTLTVIISKVNDSIDIEVNDTGSGIPQENIGKIFTPFFTTKKMGKGTGLGLAITYGIVKMHKGEIKVNSILGKGTCFIISLPIKSNIINPILN